MTRRTSAPKPPGRLATAARRKTRAVRPYLIAVAAAEILAVLAVPLLGIPLAVASVLGFGIGIGAAGHHAGSRALEAVGSRRSGGRRAAQQRRKVQGVATWLELRGLSARAARKRAKVTRPQTPGRLPITGAGVHLGKAGPLRRPVAVSHEDAVLVIGPPRSGKSAAAGNWVWDAPGACLVTSTRTDLYKNTAVPRRERGRVETLNPGGHGGIPTTFRWSPLDGCEDPDEARDAAATLMAAAPQDKGKDAYWTEGAAELLELLFFAAILGGYGIDDVQAWVMDPALAAEHALAVLDNPPLNEDGTLIVRDDGSPVVPDGWADRLAAALLASDDTPEQQSIRNAAASALRWLNSPAMRTIACAPPDQWFDVEEFIEDGTGTIYLIGADKSLAPFFAAFTGHMFRAAKRLAEASPGGRLDPPLTLALDEAAIICPVPLDDWSADAGGSGVTLLAVVQSPSQLRDRWGETGHDTIWNNTSKLIFPGLSLNRDLQDISGSCGERDTWVHVKGESGKKTRQPGKEPTIPVERIKKMPPGMALFLHRGFRPFFTRLTAVWDRKGYTPATISPAAAAMVPLDGQVMAPAVPGHLIPAALRGPMNATAPPTRGVVASNPAPRPAVEEARHG